MTGETQTADEMNGVHTLSILDLGENEKPPHATDRVGNWPTRVIDVFTASRKELEQARHDLNNRSIQQAFDDNVQAAAIRSQLHAHILNRLQTFKDSPEIG